MTTRLYNLMKILGIDDSLESLDPVTISTSTKVEETRFELVGNALAKTVGKLESAGIVALAHLTFPYIPTTDTLDKFLKDKSETLDPDELEYVKQLKAAHGTKFVQKLSFTLTGLVACVISVTLTLAATLSETISSMFKRKFEH